MIVGLAAVALQGGNIATDDIDLWVEDLASDEFQKAAQAVYIPPINLNPPLVSGPGLDDFDLVVSMSGLERFEEEFKRVRWIEMESLLVPVLPVERIVVSKRAADRPKDRAVFPILDDLVRTLKALESNQNSAADTKE